MIVIRKAEERGRTGADWLDSRHSFSFAEYYDPREMGFSRLRVINDDRIAPGGGFPLHAHRDMEIVTYVLDGAVRHRDSLGNGSVIEAGEVQRMSAGTGVTHSEFNASASAPLHLLQIWIEPDRRDHQPGYEQRRFAQDRKLNRMLLIASPDGRENSLRLNQDARIYAGVLEPGHPLEFATAPKRHLYAHLVRGAAALNGIAMRAGDGAKITGESALTLAPVEVSEALVFDLP